jgi:hypothetical protein
MKRKDEIESKISQLEQEMKYWQKMQNEYKRTNHEKENGSETYGMYQVKEVDALKKIELLKWVLS